MNLGYVLFYVADVAATATFYEKAFGLKRRFAPESGQYIEMETGATALGFVAEAFVRKSGMEFAALDPKGKPPAVEIALIADDVAEAVARAAKAGAIIVKPPEVKPWGQTVAYVRDLNGALVELCTKMA
jgi:catechol 2,3-dioxygenase-like lactoylglutathione lyase family enzyme